MSPEQAAGTRRSTPAPTSTRWPRCSTRCWPASRRSPARRRRRSSPSGSREPAPSVRAVAAERAGGGGRGDPAGARAGRRRTGSRPRPSSPRRSSGTAPARHRRRDGRGAGRRAERRAPRSPAAPARAGSPGRPVALTARPPHRRRAAVRLAAHRRAAQPERGPKVARRAPLREPGRLGRRLLRRRGRATRCAASSRQRRGPRGDRPRQLATSTAHTTKPPQEIARELGADYLLTGTVRWEKARAGASRVRVTPELVDVAARAGRRARGGSEPFDASLTDVFQVQADIATKVADALGVALGDSARRELAAKPTENLAAYDEFLKGEAASQAMDVTDPPSLRRAIGFYERAVALDSTFAAAWAQLSRARTLALLATACPTRRWASRRATRPSGPARSAPNDPLVYRAAGRLLQQRQPDRQPRGRRGRVRAGRPARARQRGPARAAAAHRPSGSGAWDSARRAARSARALLDPRSADTCAARWRRSRLFLRQYPAADSAADRALALAPTNPRRSLAQGDGRAGPGRPRQRPGGDPRGAARGSTRRRSIPSWRSTRTSTGCSTTPSSDRC